MAPANWAERINRLDRRWIFLAMATCVAIPVLFPTALPEIPTADVRNVFAAIEDLPPGSRVLISMDYDPPTRGELGPMATAFLRHLCLKRHRICIMTLWPGSIPLVEEQINRVLLGEFREQQLRYGEDYVNLGYRVGESVVIKSVATDLRQLYRQDTQNRELDTLPLLDGVQKLADFDLMLNISAGYPGTKEWIQFGTSSRGPRIASGCTGVQAPQLGPYVPNQLVGLLAAIKGAAEYEALLGERYPVYASPAKNLARRWMGPQLWAHLLMICLIIAGNVLQLFLQPARGRAR